VPPPRNGPPDHTPPSDVDKVRYVLKNLARDWSAEGAGQGLTLIPFSAQRQHIVWDTLGAFPSLSDRGTRGVVTKTA